jgi:hypothetical protein
VSISEHEVMSAASWRRLEHEAVARHEADVLAELRGLAAQQATILNIGLSEDAHAAALEVAGGSIVLVGLSPIAVVALRAARRSVSAPALAEAGRYGHWWWFRLTSQVDPLPLVATHANFTITGVSAPPTIPGEAA